MTSPLEKLIGTPRDGALLRYSLGLEYQKAGQLDILWDGLNRNKRPVFTGRYVVRVSARNVYGTTELTAAFPVRRVAVFAATGLAGFVLVASPIVIAEAKAPKTPIDQPQKDSVMLFKLGRDKQTFWMNKSNFWDAYKINIKWGLSAYNNKIVDHGFIYNNPNHGFVDPLTGILVTPRRTMGGHRPEGPT